MGTIHKLTIQEFTTQEFTFFKDNLTTLNVLELQNRFCRDFIKGMGKNSNRSHRAGGQEGKKARSKVFKIDVISCKLVPYFLSPLFFSSCPPALLPFFITPRNSILPNPAT